MSTEIKRGRPKLPEGSMETVSVRLPAEVFDVLCSSAQANRETLADLLRGVLSRHAKHLKMFTLAGRKPR